MKRKMSLEKQNPGSGSATHSVISDPDANPGPIIPTQTQNSQSGMDWNVTLGFSQLMDRPPKMNMALDQALEWRTFIHKFNRFLVGTNLIAASDLQKLTLLEDYMGEQAWDRSLQFKWEEGEDRKSFDAHVKKFQRVFEGEKDLTHFEHLLFSRAMLPGGVF